MSNKRRKYYINKGFQSRFIIKFCILIALACVVFGAIVYLLSMTSSTTAFENSRLIIKSTADYLLPVMILTALITTVIISLAVISVTLFLSHKIAGPAYRFERVAEEVAQGNLSFGVKLRSQDQLQFVAESLDVMVKSLNKRISSLREKIDNLSLIIEKQSEKNQASKEIKELIDDISREISAFKL
jgi:methyl-accepting chemotaxis protein